VTRLEILAEAAWDLEEATDWYESQRPGLGAGFTDEARSLLLRIEENPLQFPIVWRDARRALMNRFPFAVYFRLVGDVALVVAVMDLRRKVSRWLSRI
jgi:plasmid stabilization system protein ParE